MMVYLLFGCVVSYHQWNNEKMFSASLIRCHFYMFQISTNDYPALENLVKQITKEKQPFERLEMKKSDLLEMFRYNEFKQRILNEKVDTDTTTVYKCGPLIDLCRGPHVRHTGKVKALKITKVKADDVLRSYPYK